ncbi:hypothetical protein JWG44_19430 [Leptospira sp. 201903071]|uniref:tetratricopeptide repeat protein n=1 Tax=Leptospira ainazelensis TaxID=2810034 RepID=UPI0019627B4D|nr:tetratricopeptide repeat protein [Leptospira ainazelensis]MBM9502428.1 hypothetical protein [Leptospira ainazelensis]
MKFFIIFVFVFLTISEKTLDATPDSDFVFVAGYKNNPDSLKLFKFAKTFKRVGVRLVLRGIDKSEHLSVKTVIWNALRENSYFILSDLSKQRKIKIPHRKDRRGSEKFFRENLLMTLFVEQSKKRNGEKSLSFRMHWLNRNTKERIVFQTEKMFVNGGYENIQKIVYTWKSEILPIQDVFFISELRCVSNDKSMTRFLEIGCKRLREKEQDPESAKVYWERAVKISAAEYDRESIQNNLAYYYISIGDFKKAEECFLKADSLDVSESYRVHRSQLEDIREFRKKYDYYEEENSR